MHFLLRRNYLNIESQEQLQTTHWSHCEVVVTLDRYHTAESAQQYGRW